MWHRIVVLRRIYDFSLITVSSADGHFYANALMLKATPEPVENVAPVATNDFETTSKDSPVNIDIVANDADPDGTIDPATLAITGSAGHGTAVANGDGTVTYTPGAGFTGIDTFTYTVDDNDGAASNEATVTVEINAFVAYNDLSWASGQINNNITTYTAGSGLLVDYNTGNSTTVTMSIAGGGGSIITQGANANPGTDAYNVFNGIVDSLGSLVGEKPSAVKVHLSGLSTDLGRISPAGMPVLVDLARLTPGRHRLTVTAANLKLPRGIRLLSAEPPAPDSRADSQA